jgi:hypothetical protein
MRFQSFQIECSFHMSKLNDIQTKICIIFKNTTKNLINYADTIHYTFCEKKRFVPVFTSPTAS